MRPARKPNGGYPIQTLASGTDFWVAALLLLASCDKPRPDLSTAADGEEVRTPVATPLPPMLRARPAVPAGPWIPSPVAARGSAASNDKPPGGTPRLSDEELKLGFHWTRDDYDEPCWPKNEHPDARLECVNAKKVKRLMSLHRDVELVGHPRSGWTCEVAPDLVLGAAYPINLIFLLDPEGQRFRAVSSSDDAGRPNGAKLRVRGRFESRRGVYVYDERLFGGDHLPCDYHPHPVFRVKAWCVKTRKGSTPPQFEDGEAVPAEHRCGTSESF